MNIEYIEISYKSNHCQFFEEFRRTSKLDIFFIGVIKLKRKGFYQKNNGKVKSNKLKILAIHTYLIFDLVLVKPSGTDL